MHPGFHLGTPVEVNCSMFLELSDSKVLLISEDAIVLYEGTSDFEEGVAKGCPTIYRC